jgi:hypothetical protein
MIFLGKFYTIIISWTLEKIGDGGKCTRSLLGNKICSNLFLNVKISSHDKRYALRGIKKFCHLSDNI